VSSWTEYELKYDDQMERITASFDKDTLAAIRKVAGPRGVSAFLQSAARARLVHLKLVETLNDLDDQYGAPDPALQREIAADAKRIFKR
jgi:hypothetical protein